MRGTPQEVACAQHGVRSLQGGKDPAEDEPGLPNILAEARVGRGEVHGGQRAVPLGLLRVAPQLLGHRPGVQQAQGPP